MFLLKLIFLLLLLRESKADGVYASPFDFPEKLENITDVPTQQKTIGLRFRLPFMDMEIQNQKTVHVIKENLEQQQIYVLHGNELYQMFVSRDEKRLSLVGYLGVDAKELESQSAEAILWHDYLILVIAYEEYLEVYQISERILETRAAITKDPKRINETAPIFEIIQQISLPGKYRQHFLTDPSAEQLMLIVGINFTKLYGRLHTFLWTNTFFEPVEELTVPPIHKLYIVGNHPKYLIRGRVLQHQTSTIFTISEIETPSLTLHTTQTLTLNSRVVHAATFRGKHYLVACTNQQKQCETFRMSSEGQYNVYVRRPSKDLAFEQFVGGTHFLVGTRQNQVLVYTSGHLNCYASFSTNETDVTSIMTLINTHGEDFMLLNYKRPFRTLVRMVELESENGGQLGAAAFNGTDNEDTNVLSQHRHMFEESVANLRSFLLRRRHAMNTFRKISSANMSSSIKSELEMSKPVRIHGGRIHTLKLVDQNLRSPVQLLNRVAEMRQRYIARRFRREINTTKDTPTHLFAKYLKVDKLIYDGNLMEGFHLDSTAHPLPILSVRPKLETKVFNTQQLLTRYSQRRPRQELGLGAGSTTKIKELNVERINNIPWREFYESLFLRNRNKKLKGRLIIQGSAKVTQLWTPKLNDMIVDNIFNLVDDQVVDTNILFNAMLIGDLKAQTVNGLDFANDIVFANEDSFIETPVNLQKVSINDLIFGDNVTLERAAEDEMEFRQHYTGKVVINGTLTVKNLATSHKARIVIDGKPFSETELKENYLLWNQTQVFNKTVKFGNARVIVPRLETQFLNDNPIDNYLMVDQVSNMKKPVQLIFLNATIEGDLKSKTRSTKLAELNRNVVRQGDIADITGKKIFLSNLNIDNLTTLKLNQLPVSELVLKSELKQGIKLKGIKTFKSLHVDDETSVKHTLNAIYLNRLPLSKLLHTDLHFDKLHLPFRLNVSNIVVHKINDVDFDDIFNNFEVKDEQLVLHKDLIVEGSVEFQENLELTSINDIDWAAYQTNLVRVNESAVITGKKSFEAALSITKLLKTSTINGFHMDEIFEQILMKSKAQVINGSYSFGNVQFTNLDVEYINDIPTAEFIDLRRDNVTIEGDVIVPKVVAFGKVTADESLQLQLQNFCTQLVAYPKHQWRRIIVTGNATWPESTERDNAAHEHFKYLQQYAVQRTGKQVISGNVKLNYPIITRMHTKTAFLKDFDLDFFAKDCLLKSANFTQIITATKEFATALEMQNIEVKENLNTYLLNTIDVARLNASLYRLSSNAPIIGPIHFQIPPKIGHLVVNGRINGIEPAVIYHTAAKKIMPPVKIRKLNVAQSLKIGDINDESFDLFLQQRLKKKGPAVEINGTLTFENLVLNETLKFETINGIPLDNLVYKKSTYLQPITAPKIIKGNLILEGPVHVQDLNGSDLSDIYNESIFTNRDYHFDSLALDEATFEAGIIFTKTLPPDFVGAISNSRNSTKNITDSQVLTQQTEYEILSQELDALSELVNAHDYQKQQLLYLDYTLDWRIIWQQPNVTIEHSFQHELKPTSLCERQHLNVQLTQTDANSGLIYLSNSTTNFITANAYNLSIKAENFCQHKYRKTKSKITITAPYFSKVIGWKKYIESINIYTPTNESDIFILLHAAELTQNQHEVRILKIPRNLEEAANITDWQSLSLGIGKTLRLYQNRNFTALVSGGGGLIDKHPATVIYHFDVVAQKFKHIQTIDGYFDVIELIAGNTQKSAQYQLILSCQQCQRVHIYHYNSTSMEKPYEIFQIIKLTTLIDKLQPFTLKDGSLYLLLLAEHEQQFYYLYRFTQLQGWLHTTYGFFDGIEIAVPLLESEKEIVNNKLLLLLCGLGKCSVVKAVLA